MSTKSFLPVTAESHFSLANLPYGIFRVPGKPWRAGTAIGDNVVDLDKLEREGLFSGTSLASKEGVFSKDSLNKFMSLGRPTWLEVRARLTELLSADNPELRDNAALRAEAIIPMEMVEMGLPAKIGDYTDFFVSKYHTQNCNDIFRNTRKVFDNWFQLPVGYHSRASSIVVSGTDVRRPRGQYPGPDGAPVEGPSQRLDFELELACFIGPGNEQGSSIPIKKAEDHVFGMVIMNDWSARDIQKWEAVPLGPFNGKNFATTISPWVVTLEALEPFKCAPPPRDVEILPYLQPETPTVYDIQLEVAITPAGQPSPSTVSRSNYKHMYWTLSQFVTHHSKGGCNLQPGDLMGTGTISGPTDDSLGCMLELSWGGTRPVSLGGGIERAFLEDGDIVTFRGFCQGNGFRVGFGDCTGRVLPARPADE